MTSNQPYTRCPTCLTADVNCTPHAVCCDTCGHTRSAGQQRAGVILSGLAAWRRKQIAVGRGDTESVAGHGKMGAHTTPPPVRLCGLDRGRLATYSEGGG